MKIAIEKFLTKQNINNDLFYSSLIGELEEIIEEELSKDNWELISEEYQNLDSELVFKCSEGHTVFAPWKKLRTKRECPICKHNTLKEQDLKIIPKKYKKIKIN